MTKRKQVVTGKDGTAKTVRLSEAALAELQEHAAEIAKHLAVKARRGEAMSVRLLIELANASEEAKSAIAAHPLLSLALQLAAEPEMPDVVADGGVGNKEG